MAPWLKSSPEQADAASTHFRHHVRTLLWMPLWHLTVTEGANPIFFGSLMFWGGPIATRGAGRWSRSRLR